jgi:L-threonylcarbamoyladenylate synthase
LSRAAELLDRAAAVVRRGGVVVYPTETVYGLGADATNEAALAGLVALKGRPETKGMSILVPGLEESKTLLAVAIPDAARSLAAAFWPGPLTIVLPAAHGVAASLVGPGGGIGLRCSADPIARALVERVGCPITSTSANPSGSVAATSVEEARGYFGARIECYVDGGERRTLEVSTVVEFFERGAILRRAGAISAEDLAAVLPRIRLEI